MGEVSGSYHPVAFRQPYLGPLALLPNFNPETFSQQSAPALGLPMNPLTPTSLASRTSVQENQSTYGSTEEDGGSEEIKKSKRARKSMDLTAYLLDGGVHPPDYSNFPLNFKSHHHAWESCAEELAQAKGAWMQPQNDDTIPETQEDRENVVSQLLGAMVDMSYSEDKDSRVNKARWTDGNAAYDIKQLEKCCWDIAVGGTHCAVFEGKLTLIDDYRAIPSRGSSYSHYFRYSTSDDCQAGTPFHLRTAD